MIVAKMDEAYPVAMKGGWVLDKGGFYDGDILFEHWEFFATKHVLDEMVIHEFSNGPGPGSLSKAKFPYRSAEYLCDVVRECVLPRLPVKVEIEKVSTCHNPARAVKIEGEDFTDEDGRIWRELLNEITVEVSSDDLETVFIRGCMDARKNAEAAAA